MNDKNFDFSGPEDGGTFTVILSGEIDHNRAAPVRGIIDDQLIRRQPKNFILDLSGIDFMDSSGLGLILGRYSKAEQIGADFKLKNPSECVLKILQLAGADKIIGIINDSEKSQSESHNDLKPPQKQFKNAAK